MAAQDVALNLVEVFSSVQGEGPDVGRSTLFVRLGECDLRCRWCDSPGTWKPALRCRFELDRGSGRFEELPNPVTLERLLEATERLELGAHHMVSLTGGEPLLQPLAAAAAAERFAAAGPEVLLETHGLHHEALRVVLPHLQVVSMDWKLATDVRRRDAPARVGAATFHEEHERFLAVARAAPRVVVKLVITSASEDAEVDEAVRRVARTHPEASLVFQPVTPCAGVKERPPAERLLELTRRAEALHADVRLVPQTHPIYGVL